ncbi:DMT family transporter [Amorphus coralli]|uniref:DMT family transporter n=1 Tax=Amorphus coralli TaxID=340680 RepID=UPI00036267E7|nr:SMR family transporter [Amorphus coralli]
MHYVTLSLAILFEVIATSMLKATDGFSRIGLTVAMFACYLCSFYFLTLTIRMMPIGIVYAIWAGLGIVLVAIAGAVIYKEMLDVPAMIGMAFIIGGVVIINTFSKTVAH